MKLFGLGKQKAQQQAPEQGQRCSHPVDHQEPLHEDPAEPKKVTAMKCYQCGARIPLPGEQQRRIA